MIKIDLEQPGCLARSFMSTAPVLIGKALPSTLIVDNWKVAHCHAILRNRRGTLWIQDQETWIGTWVNGRRIVAETPLDPNDVVSVGPASIRFTWCAPPETSSADSADIKSALLDSRVVESSEFGASATELLAGSGQATLGANNVGGSMRDGINIASSRAEATHASRSSGLQPVAWEHGPEAIALRKRLQQQLRDALDLRREDVAVMSDLQLRARAHELLEVLMRDEKNACPAEYGDEFLQGVLDDAVGLGPLEALLREEAVTEIMVNRYDEIYVERYGRLTRIERTFSDNDAVLGVIERIVAPLGRRIDESSPMVDARLPDGSRVNGVIPPIALKGPTLTIRKFPAKRLSLEELVAAECIHPYMAAFLATAVARKKNIIVSGGTGSGKTTLLNILSGLIGPDERVVTIEDAAELKLPHEHVVSLEARPANVEGQGLITIRDLVRNALRMRPDRIVVGECRGGEAFDMLAAMNTGHAGSLTTLHANTPRDALARLETMILMAGMDLPLAAIREHIAGAIDLIVQQVRREDGKRLITDISEVSGMESGQIQLQPLFHRQRHAKGWTSAGVVPAFVEEWREEGVFVDAAWFRLGLSLEEGRECSGPLR